MADDKSKSGPADRTRINVNEDYELRYWTAKFGCTTTELKAAVAAVGVMADKVELTLRRTALISGLAIPRRRVASNRGS
jgi:hypothetical protein